LKARPAINETGGALVPETVSLLTPRKSVQGSRWEYLTRGGQIQ
jgi:hypothetical protein